MGETAIRHRRLVISVVVGLFSLCILYCLFAPNEYEASGRVALGTAPNPALSMGPPEATAAATVLSAPLQLETLATTFRSDRLAWRVIAELRLYDTPGFQGSFRRHFPDFHIDAPTPTAQAYLLERYQKRLHVQSLPHTLLIDIRFRSRNAALSAAVVNALIRAYGQQESETRQQATAEASGWVQGQLKELKNRGDQDELRLSTFQQQHGIVSTPEMLANGEQGESQHASVLLEIDELGRQQVAATTDRILREAEYRAASQGDPELVLASDPHMQADAGTFATALLQQLHARHSDLDQELAQLSTEHGPEFPRVVEIRQQLQDLDRQIKTEDGRLLERFHRALQTAVDREQMVRKSLDERTAEAMPLNKASMQYAVMRREADASHQLYLRVLGRVEEAGLLDGIHVSTISVVDYARQPIKPVAPNPPLYLAITFFASLWLALGAAVLMDYVHPGSTSSPASAALLALLLAGAGAHCQAPTPSTSGLPSGVAHFPSTPAPRTVPNPKEAPAVWNEAGPAPETGLPTAAAVRSQMAAPIGPGDLLDISEFHTPEFHSIARVSASGTVTLPLVKEIQIGGMTEQTAAQAIEAALLTQGMLLHPQVSVQVMVYAGQDVSVLGEVTRPGVYPFTLHHRLLDLISAASGLSPSAGRLVNIFRRGDPETPHPVVLDPSGTATGADHNPELTPGDTVQVSRAGLVYVIGDVIRPGGFPVDPAQGLTVVQALSLAWGPTANAATGKALLIREQKGGRTLTTLNVKRMLHGQDPDQPIHDRDILYLPDSAAKNLWNKTMESAIQSALGVSIYAGLVYSQRF